MAKILIVEDDADLVETYTDLLEVQGHTVIWAAQIGQATSQLIKEAPDIVTLDLNLPGSSTAAIIAFAQSAKLTSQCRIVIISGHAEIASDTDLLDNADLVLTKPVDNQHLLVMIERLLFAQNLDPH